MEYDSRNTIEQIRQLNLTGNIIPHSWYSKITFKNGTPDLLGIVILADIVYWYRPVEIKDEKTGRLIGYKKKFRADMLQRSLASFATQFGYNKRQIADALKRLEDAGLIIKKLRTIETAMGVMNNVLFVAPIPSAIAVLDHTDQQDYSAEISLSNDDSTMNDESALLISSNVPPTTIERSRGYDRTYQVVHSNVVGGTSERSTYTKNTTKITTENTATDETNDFKHSKSIAAAFSEKNKIQILPADLIIADALTVYQTQCVQTTAETLSAFVATDSVTLAKEIEYVILSVASFSNAHPDFNKKLNTIKKIIKEKRWSMPVEMIEKKETLQKKEIDPIKRELNEAELDCAHWRKMIDLAVEKNQGNEVENFKSFLQAAQRKIDDIKMKFSSFMNSNENRNLVIGN